MVVALAWLMREPIMPRCDRGDGTTDADRASRRGAAHRVESCASTAPRPRPHRRRASACHSIGGGIGPARGDRAGAMQVVWIRVRLVAPGQARQMSLV